MDIADELVERLLGLDWETVRAGVWIYGLSEGDGATWYVGSTKAPLARLIEHLRGGTKDTAGRVTTATRMMLLDLADPADRLKAEARWIDRTPTACNTCRYPGVLAKAPQDHAGLLSQTLASLGL